jgi:hypothetical protein
LARNMKDVNCFHYYCSANETRCDNTLPTNYDGPEPPCCVHILRDVARVFDETMANLGLDYAAAYGTLLGLRRSDRLIPWTIDNDFIIPSQEVANAMVALWDPDTTGLAHVVQLDMNRMCITPDFANGKLKRWTNSSTQETQVWRSKIPYIDLYVVGKTDGETILPQGGPCRYFHRDVFPTKRVWVYNKSFAQNFPARPEEILRTSYGEDWMIPRSDKSPHGAGEDRMILLSSGRAKCYGPAN